MRKGRLEGAGAVDERQQRVTAEGDNGGLVISRQKRQVFMIKSVERTCQVGSGKAGAALTQGRLIS